MCVCDGGGYEVKHTHTHTQTYTLGPAIRQLGINPHICISTSSLDQIFHFLLVLVLLSSFASYGVQSVEAEDENVRELGDH